MSARLNLSRRDAWSRVSQYVGLWLLFWLGLGIAGGVGHNPAPTAISADTPMSPVLVDAPVASPLALRGKIKRVTVEHAAPGRGTVQAAEAHALPAAPPVHATSVSSEPTDTDFHAAAPAGFEDLIGVQNTQADVFFQGRMLLSTFIEFDLEHLWFLAPEEIIAAIPTLKNPDQVLAALSGQLNSNSHLVCNLRVREDCGVLEPDIAGIIFNESKFRIDLFVHQSELSVQLVSGDKYLPAPSAGWAMLHDLGFTASGQQGDDAFNLSGESFVSKGAGRARVRYGVTNSGPLLHEASWQWDSRDQELELGVFRGARGNSLFINDKRLLGLRLGSSTKTRTDLDNALATPVLIFLDRRSRVDILRDTELLDSRFYEAGNHQLNTTRLPDGAYDITVRTVAADGEEQTQEHFFVRNSLLPPLGENQYYVEAGAFTEEFGSSLPRTVGGGWLRGGLSHRLSDGFALEGELLLSKESSLFQGGAYFLGRGWQMHTGAMASDRGDRGYSFRASFARRRLSLALNAQHLESKTDDLLAERFESALTSNVDFELADDLGSIALQRQLINQRGVVGGSYTQASATLSFPLQIPYWKNRSTKGQARLRAQYNQRNGGNIFKGIGFNYYSPLFRRNSIRADWSLESLFSSERSLVRLGVDFRWRDGRQRSLVRPQLLASQTTERFSGEREPFAYDPVLNADWSRTRRSERIGDVSEGVYFAHQGDRSVLGGRLSSQSNYGYADLDVAYAQGPQQGFQYVANSRFNLVSKDGKSAIGGGSSQLAAIVVEIEGDLPNADFKIIVGSRVAGYASTTRRGVVSLRPYDTYDVRIQPAGDDILGYDENTYEVTLFPGNVHRLVFSARELRVVIAQAMDENGGVLPYGKFTNVEGYGATDAQGWFQVEVSHSDDLQVRLADGSFCAITLPPPAPEDDGLAVLDALVCRTIPEPPSE